MPNSRQTIFCTRNMSQTPTRLQLTINAYFSLQRPIPSFCTCELHKSGQKGLEWKLNPRLNMCLEAPSRSFVCCDTSTLPILSALHREKSRQGSRSSLASPGSQGVHQVLESTFIMRMRSLQGGANRVTNESVHRIKTSWHLLGKNMNHEPIFFCRCLGTTNVKLCNGFGYRHNNISTSTALLQNTSGSAQKQSCRVPAS